MAATRTSARVGFLWLERLWQDVKYGCRMLASSPGVHHRLRPLAGDRHRRELRDFQLRRRAAVAAAAGRPAGRGLHRGLDLLARSARRQLAGVLVSRLRRHPRSQQELRRTGRVLVCHRRLRDRSEGAAEAEDGHAGQRQPVLADGRRADHRPRVHGPTRIRSPAATPSSSSAARCGSRNSDPTRAVLGRTVRINGHDFTVIGVAPPSFTGMNQYVRSDFFVPLMMSPRADRAIRRLDRSRRATPGT